MIETRIKIKYVYTKLEDEYIENYLPVPEIELPCAITKKENFGAVIEFKFTYPGYHKEVEIKYDTYDLLRKEEPFISYDPDSYNIRLWEAIIKGDNSLFIMGYFMVFDVNERMDDFSFIINLESPDVKGIIPKCLNLWEL